MAVDQAISISDALPHFAPKFSINPPPLVDHALPIRFANYIRADFEIHPEITESIFNLVNAAFMVNAVRFSIPRLVNHDQLLANVAKEGSYFSVFYSGDTPIAAGVIEPVEDEQLTCKLYLFCTVPSSTRTGYGTRLLAHIESLAYEKGYRKMLLQVVKEHEHVMQFYSRRGYKVYRETKRPDENGDWLECTTWGPTSPFTLCDFEKTLHGP